MCPASVSSARSANISRCFRSSARGSIPDQDRAVPARGRRTTPITAERERNDVATMALEGTISPSLLPKVGGRSRGQKPTGWPSAKTLFLVDVKDRFARIAPAARSWRFRASKRAIRSGRLPAKSCVKDAGDDARPPRRPNRTRRIGRSDQPVAVHGDSHSGISGKGLYAANSSLPLATLNPPTYLPATAVSYHRRYERQLTGPITFACLEGSDFFARAERPRVAQPFLCQADKSRAKKNPERKHRQDTRDRSRSASAEVIAGVSQRPRGWPENSCLRPRTTLRRVHRARNGGAGLPDRKRQAFP